MADDDVVTRVFLPDAVARANAAARASASAFGNPAAAQNFFLGNSMAPAASAPFNPSGADDLDDLFGSGGKQADSDLSVFTQMRDTGRFASLLMNSKGVRKQISEALDAGESVTIFAPNNEAMAAMPGNAFEKLKTDEFADHREKFVGAHVAIGMKEKYKDMHARAKNAEQAQAIHDPTSPHGCETLNINRHVAVTHSSAGMASKSFRSSGHVVGSAKISATLEDTTRPLTAYIVDKPLTH